MPHDSLCDEDSKNVYFVEVRKVEGQKPHGHTVKTDKNTVIYFKERYFRGCPIRVFAAFYYLNCPFVKSPYFMYRIANIDLT